MKNTPAEPLHPTFGQNPGFSEFERHVQTTVAEIMASSRPLSVKKRELYGVLNAVTWGITMVERAQEEQRPIPPLDLGQYRLRRTAVPVRPLAQMALPLD